MGQNRCRRSGRRACVTVNGRVWNVGQPGYSQSDRAAVDAIAALVGRRDCKCPAVQHLNATRRNDAS